MGPQAASLAEQLDRLPAVPMLRGRRACLRAIGDGDVDQVFALYSDPEVMRHWPRAPMSTRAEALAHVEECIAHFAQRERLCWAITRGPAPEMLGSCTLFGFDAKRRCAEIGYALQRSQWGRGLASEAVALAIGWAFPALGLERIEAEVEAGNAASRRLLRTLGFRCDDAGARRFRLEAADWRDGAQSVRSTGSR